MEINRFDVLLISLDPAEGSEIKKTRPCLVISPDEMNRHLRTVLIAPLSTSAKSYPTRVNCKFKKTTGQVVLEQIRTIDRSRVRKNLGKIDIKTSLEVLKVLTEMFAP